jgi:hypothetical protein
MQYDLEFDESFEGDTLDLNRWLPYYLPHWSSRERSAARYEIGRGHLRLLIEPDQEPWCPEFDGENRVSSLQTGAFAGPLGSAIGQQRFNPKAVVREAQPNMRLYTPRYGRIELRAKANDDPRTMVALWMIGYEDEPERSAEICICEIFGHEVGADHALVGMGLHPFGDPRIVDVGEAVKTAEQSPAYPMQLMLSLYEFPPEGDQPARPSPKEFVVNYVRGYALTA